MPAPRQLLRPADDADDNLRRTYRRGPAAGYRRRSHRLSGGSGNARLDTAGVDGAGGGGARRGGGGAAGSRRVRRVDAGR